MFHSYKGYVPRVVYLSYPPPPPLNITLVTVAVFFIIPLHTILFGDEHFVVHSITQ